MAEISITKTKRDRAEACRALRRNDQKRAKDFDEHGGKLSIFLVRDHGSLPEIFGGVRTRSRS